MRRRPLISATPVISALAACDFAAVADLEALGCAPFVRSAVRQAVGRRRVTERSGAIAERTGRHEAAEFEPCLAAAPGREAPACGAVPGSMRIEECSNEMAEMVDCHRTTGRLPAAAVRRHIPVGHAAGFCDVVGRSGSRFGRYRRAVARVSRRRRHYRRDFCHIRSSDLLSPGVAPVPDNPWPNILAIRSRRATIPPGGMDPMHRPTGRFFLNYSP